MGNPGDEYRYTRHNAGFLVIDALTEMLGIRMKKKIFSSYCCGKGVYEGNEIFLIKPLTYMNRSGLVIKSIIKKLKIDLSGIVVVCDNMDLYPGVIRFKTGGGNAGHNGLKSIIEHSETENIKRFYIGIGKPSADRMVVEHVLGIPGEQELKLFLGSINQVAEFVLEMVNSSPEKVMNEVNRIKNNPNNTIS